MRFVFPKKFSLVASASALTLIYLGAGVFAPNTAPKFFSITPAQAASKTTETTENFQKLQDEILEPESPDSNEKTEVQNNGQNNGQSGDLPLTDPAQKSPESGEPSKGETASAPAFQPTTILPSKIKPVHDGGSEDGLSRAAAPIQSTAQISEESTTASAQSLGLLTLALSEDEHVGNEWTKLKTKDLIEKFLQIDADQLSPTEAKNAVAALSSYVPADLAEESKSQKTPPKNSAELYSVRLKKLLEFGEFEKIIQLYKMNDGAPPSADALYAGVVSMLATGDQALACLEYKAGNPEFRQNSAAFWAHMGVFCNALVSPAASGPSPEIDAKNKPKDSKSKNSPKAAEKDGSKAGLSPTQNPDGLMDSVKLAQLESRKKWINAARLYLAATHQNTTDSLPSGLAKLNETDPLTLLAWGGTGMLNALLKSPAALAPSAAAPAAATPAPATAPSPSQPSHLSDLTRLSSALLLRSGLEDPVILQALRDVQTKEKPEGESTSEQKGGL